MNLLELVACYLQRVEGGVLDWMFGYFRWCSISFVDGRSDECTQVYWLQSRSFIIDLRLPDVFALLVWVWQDYDVVDFWFVGVR